MVDPGAILWPKPWQAIADEREALSFGRAMSGSVGSSIIGELHREICPSHPLFGVECRPLAYDAKVKKDFLLETNRPEMPLVMVHFTWAIEKDPRWPFFFQFGNISEFLEWARQN